MAGMIRTWALMGIVCCFTTLTAQAQLAGRQETLRGHRQIYVAVSVPEDDATTRELGLRKATLERYILDRLKEQNVPASTEFKDQTLILEIRVDLHEALKADGKRVFAFLSQFDCMQAARLATNRQSTLAATWRATQFGVISRDQAQLLRDSVLRNLDAFVADWKEAQKDDATTPSDSPSP